MELFQELLFTISFSLIVSLFIAKLFSMASDCDVSEPNTVSASKAVRFEEKDEKESVVCDSVTKEKVQYFEEAVKEVDDHEEEVSRVGGLHKEKAIAETVFDESPETAVEIEVRSFEESPERTDSVEIELVKSNEVNIGNESDGVKNEEELFDDWEGIERTELEHVFAAAVAFVGSKSNVNRISVLNNEAKMQLYGLHKIAVEGPCFDPQPMALKVSARANWNAWKRLGSVSPEEAMEQYIALLSQNIRDWMVDDTSEDNKQAFLATGRSGNLPFYSSMVTGAVNEREMEQLKPFIGDPNFLNRDKQ